MLMPDWKTACRSISTTRPNTQSDVRTRGSGAGGAGHEGAGRREEEQDCSSGGGGADHDVTLMCTCDFVLGGTAVGRMPGLVLVLRCVATRVSSRSIWLGLNRSL